MRILYDSKSPRHKKPFGTLCEGEECTVTIYIPKHCKTNAVLIEFFKEDSKVCEFELSFLGMRDENYEKWSGSFALSAPDLYFYRFYLKTAESDFPLYKEGFSDTNIWQGDFWQLTCIPKDFSVPSELSGRVMYQIFPDRFFKKGNVDASGKLEPYYIHKSTDEMPDFRGDENGVVRNCDFFGGNLSGIKEKLPYLKRLGVSVIYLNPIFKAYSNHRYDTADYKKIDELLGTEKDFKSLCKKAHRLGIKIILDGVFSHTGSNSIYFDAEKIFGNGAASHSDSPYREWFDFQHYPDTYTSWWGIKTLPCVNEMNESYREYIYGAEDSVIAHWLSAGADGFRLDVADELPDEFIGGLRARLKEIKKDALLIGEVWEDASNKISYGQRRRYFSGGELDSVMNYPFRNAILDFVVGKDGGENLLKTVLTICENYPRQVVNVLMNSLSTHDTPRVISLLGADRVPESKDERALFRLSKEQYAISERRLKCAAFLQFTLPGMPCIYYGDEIGAEGLEDPFCRGFFDWDKEKTSTLRAFFERLSALRNKNEALLLGETEIECVESGVVKLLRRGRKDSITAYVNCSQQSFEVGCSDKLIFSENTSIKDGEIIIEPYGFAAFKTKS